MSFQNWSVIAGETPTATKWNILGENDAEFETRVTQLEVDKILNVTSDNTTVTFNLNTSKIHTVTLGGNRTLAVSNVSVGESFVVRLVQGSGGNKSVTWWSGIKWPGGQAPSLSLAEGSIDTFGFVCTSSGNYDGYFVGFGLEE